MSNLLSRSPEEAVRLIALTLLGRVEEAVTRLDDPEDDEALHRFRVSVRRLRSVLRAYRAPLQGSVKKKDRRRLRDLAALTGEGRDAEVAAEWLEDQRRHLDAGQQQGLDWLLGRFRKRRGKGYEEARTTIADRILPLVDDLRDRLKVYTREISLEGRGRGDVFGELVGEEVTRELQRLETLLVQVEAPDDATHVHDARLSTKRLRYLLEPLVPELGAAAAIVKNLKRLQDLLGELNDAYVLERDLEDAVETAARKRARTLLAEALGETAKSGAMGEPGDAETAETGDGPPAAEAGQATGPAATFTRAGARDPHGDRDDRSLFDGDWGPVDGVLALARRNRERRDGLFGELREGWIAEDAEAAPRRRDLADAVRDLAHWLEAGFSPPPPVSDEPAPTSAPST